MSITFEREKLYEEAWSEPLTKLATKYGLSDNGLRKICKAMNIPLPTAGHWAKVAAGHAVPKVPLPADAERTSYTSDPPANTHMRTPSPFHLPEDDTWLCERQLNEQRPEAVIEVSLQPGQWHPILGPVRKKLKERLAEVEQWRRIAERSATRTAKGRSSAPSSDDWKWRRFLHDGQLLMEWPLRITLKTQERAMSIANALCYAAEARGFTPKLGEKESHLELTGHGETLILRISEKLNQEMRKEPRYPGGPIDEQRVKVPSGLLRLFSGRSSYTNDEIAADDSKVMLESKLNAAFLRLYRQIIRTRQQAREHADRQHRWKVADERRARVARRRERQRKRRGELHRELRSWRQAEELRTYVARIADTFESEPRDEDALRRFRVWRSWAMQVADRLDPITDRVARFEAPRNARIEDST